MLVDRFHNLLKVRFICCVCGEILIFLSLKIILILFLISKTT